jgi:hypothetical protein
MQFPRPGETVCRQGIRTAASGISAYAPLFPIVSRRSAIGTCAQRRIRKNRGTMHRAKALFAFLAFALVLAACGCGEKSTDPPPAADPRVYPEKSVVHWRSFESWDTGTIEEAATSNLIIFPLAWCYSTESRGILSEIRRLNPDIQIIGYQSVMGVATLYPDTTYLRKTIPYVLDYYDAVRSDWAWTTAGDTLMIWKDLISLNPIKNGALNTGLIEKLVDLIAEYQNESGAPVDGIMHDYFCDYFYINPDIRDIVLGDIDLDGDGLVFADDTGEQELFYLWQKEYARAIRERFGDDFIQIGNGRPPHEDEELAHYLNGVFYELYPNNCWSWTDRDGLLDLLDNQRAGYLSKAKGRTWSLCTNEKGNANGNNMFCLLSSLVAGCLYTEMQGSYEFSGWTLDVEPGTPTGPASIEGSLDSVLTVRRPFEKGEVKLSFYDTGRRLEYAFLPSPAPAP